MYIYIYMVSVSGTDTKLLMDIHKTSHEDLGESGFCVHLCVVHLFTNHLPIMYLTINCFLVSRLF